MKKLLIVLWVLALSCALYADTAGYLKNAQGEVTPVGYNAQFPTGDDSAFGFVDLATTTQEFSPDVATRIDTSTLKTRKLYVTAYGGALLFGHENDLATGSFANGISIASGTQGYIGGILGTTTPPIWGMPTGAATVTAVYSGWGNE